MAVEGSPFVVAGPAGPDDVIGRHETLATLLDRAMRGRFVLLMAPRRYGKTTLVHRMQRDAEQTKDLDVVIVDLLGIQTLEDLALRLAQAWTRLPRGPLSRASAGILPYVQGLEIRGGIVGLQLQRRPRDARDSAVSTLEAVLDVPRRVAERTGRRLLVVLDEFQAVAGVERADAIMRSQIQHHTDQVSYLFCGSERSTLRMLFDDRARPLYGQAEQVELGPFDPDALGAYVEGGLEEGGRSLLPEAVAGYLAFVAGHPQRAMLLADCIWATVATGEVVDAAALAAAVDEGLRRCRAEFDGVWTFLTPAQRRLARLVAWGEPITGAGARRLGLPQGSARAAAATLEGLSLLDPDPARAGRYRLTDPFLAEWIRRLGPEP